MNTSSKYKQLMEVAINKACQSIMQVLHLVGLPLGEANAEQLQHVVISGLDIDMILKNSLPLLHQ
jgi:hypothetical protein